MKFCTKCLEYTNNVVSHFKMTVSHAEIYDDKFIKFLLQKVVTKYTIKLLKLYI